MATDTEEIVLFGNSIENIVTVNTKPKISKKMLIITVIVALLTGLYCTAIFSNIPIIKKWRDIYIETAMDTFNHKWLATLFIPKSIINQVVANKEALIEQQQSLESTWDSANGLSQSLMVGNRNEFFNKFSEINKSTFNDYVSKNPDVLENGYGKLLINKAGLNDSGTSIFTNNGDQVLAIDAENGILIVKVVGYGFVGKMAIVKDPSKVKVGVSSTLGTAGKSVQQIAKANNAILAINASGFADYQGSGNGGKVVGLLISKGKELNEPFKNGYLNIGFSYDNRLYIGLSNSQIKYRDAVEFIPALIINGKNVISEKAAAMSGKNIINDEIEIINSKNVVKESSAFGFGIQPRTAIGQEADGTVLLLTVDGRKVGYSLGCTVGDCADILEKYGAVQASNLDGGSSTIMVYRGENITKPADSVPYGRLVPNAIIVEYTAQETKK